MRAAFIETLCQLAREDERLWLLTGDLGFSVLERFRDEFPGRFLNVGVAEQNMAGIAAGLAMSGKVAFIYSIANFPTFRCLEQLRTDGCYANVDLKVVAVGGGMAYGTQGYTHHGLEDLAVLRALPNMAVVAPGDPVEVRLAMRAVLARPGPCYLRLGKGGEPTVHSPPPPFAVGRVIPVREGGAGLVVSTGGLLSVAVEAAAQAAASGVAVAVWSSPWVKPLDVAAVQAAAARYPWLVTVEEAQVTGGLGSAVAEVVAAMSGPRAALVRLGVPDTILHCGYSQAAARAHFGFDAAGIARQVCQLAAAVPRGAGP